MIRMIGIGGMIGGMVGIHKPNFTRRIRTESSAVRIIGRCGASAEESSARPPPGRAPKNLPLALSAGLCIKLSMLSKMRPSSGSSHASLRSHVVAFQPRPPARPRPGSSALWPRSPTPEPSPTPWPIDKKFHNLAESLDFGVVLVRFRWSRTLQEGQGRSRTKVEKNREKNRISEV